MHRKIALEGHRFTPKEALQAGFIDYIVDGNTEAILAKAEQVAEVASPLAREGVWGIIKVRLWSWVYVYAHSYHVRQSDLHRTALEHIAKDVRTINALVDDAAAKSRL